MAELVRTRGKFRDAIWQFLLGFGENRMVQCEVCGIKPSRNADFGHLKLPVLIGRNSEDVL